MNGSDKEFFFREGCWITELHNAPEDPSISVARVRVAPGDTTRLHSLVKTVERYLILEGNGIVTLGQDPAFEVRPEDTVFIPAEVAQKISNTSEVDLIFLAICTPRFEERNYRDLE